MGAAPRPADDRASHRADGAKQPGRTRVPRVRRTRRARLRNATEAARGMLPDRLGRTPVGHVREGDGRSQQAVRRREIALELEGLTFVAAASDEVHRSNFFLKRLRSGMRGAHRVGRSSPGRARVRQAFAGDLGGFLDALPPSLGVQPLGRLVQLRVPEPHQGRNRSVSRFKIILR